MQPQGDKGERRPRSSSRTAAHARLVSFYAPWPHLAYLCDRSVRFADRTELMGGAWLVSRFRRSEVFQTMMAARLRQQDSSLSQWISTHLMVCETIRHVDQGVSAQGGHGPGPACALPRRAVWPKRQWKTCP